MSALLHDAAFWTSLGVIVLIAAIWRKVVPAMNAALDGRAEKIKRTLDEAAELHEQARHLLAEYQRKQRDASKEADELLASARREAERVAKEAADSLERTLARRQQMALDKIAQAEAEALREVRELSIDLAIAATRTLIAEKLGSDQSTKMVDTAIAEIGKKLH